MNRFLQIFLRILFFAVLVFSAWQILSNSKSIQKKKEANAVFHDVSMGLFSPNEWKCKVISIIDKRLENLDVSLESEKLVNYVDSVYRASTQHIRTMNLGDSLANAYSGNDGNFLEKSFSVVSSLFSNGSSFISQKGLDIVLDIIEGYVIERIKNNDELIKDLISDQVQNAIHSNLETSKESKSYTLDCEEKAPPVLHDFSDENKQVELYVLVFIGVCFIYYLITVLLFLRKKKLGKIILIDSLFIGLICLILGVLLPMMEINASVEALEFNFLGETISFQNQYIYYRSKSIFDIVTILIHNNVLVAVLIFAFSIVTPLTKLIASLLIIFSEKAGKNKILNAIVQKIGKWSMADVFVVAIFLATLGYQGIISEQMEGVERIKHLKTTLNTEQSTLEIGFYFFLAYCMISLVSSHFIKRRV
ncbi:MAG: paraquat-inducible protein A [Bacteroidales bacterium]|nr:paraquat-inducible protein A [Bacteroidales bacterium]